MLIIDYEYPMVKTLWVVCKSSTVVDGSKDRPSISHMIGCYMFLEKKLVRKLKKKLNNLRKNKKKIVEIQYTTNFQAQLSTSCYTHFVLLLFCTCISTKSFIYFGLNPRTVVCKRKTLLVKHIHIKQQFLKNRCNKKEFYHPLRMRNKHNGFADIRDNKTVNLLVPIFRRSNSSLTFK